MLANVGKKAGQAARRGVLVLLALVFLGVGLVFLTLGLWQLLLPVGGKIMAAFVVGTLYFALGAVLLCLGLWQGRRSTPAAPLAQPGEGHPHPYGVVAAAFMQGLTAGMTRRSR